MFDVAGPTIPGRVTTEYEPTRSSTVPPQASGSAHFARECCTYADGHGHVSYGSDQIPQLGPGAGSSTFIPDAVMWHSFATTLESLTLTTIRWGASRPRSVVSSRYCRGCPDSDRYTGFAHPLISGAALPTDYWEDFGGRLAVHTGLFAGSTGALSRKVMNSAHLYQWLVEGRIPALFCVIHSEDKLEGPDQSPRNEGFVAFCCRKHLEAYLDIFRRWELRRPLRGDGPNGRPTMSFMTRSLAAFTSSVYEQFENGESKASGSTPAETSLSRYLILLREAWDCNKSIEDIGLKPPTSWDITSDELRPYHKPSDDDWIQQSVTDAEHARANMSLRMSKNTRGFIRSLAHPAEARRGIVNRRAQSGTPSTSHSTQYVGHRSC
ncbi:hypothetical protein FOZ60_007700 [Perkinsus olseni]|uniref:Uncharacterized protein n=3 Tax=Perkinsus olseni TaxID=32597 RepID=A0A7J6NL33_PEROL|nr:hypothetical protein FOZ60_007700 [Perkinsus olseni]